MFLLDTNVISELRKNKPHSAVLAWYETVDEGDLFLSAVTVGEIQAGIEKVREQDSTKAIELEAWLNNICKYFNILSADARVFKSWAKLIHKKSSALDEDALIAATAQVHGLTVATRNTANFKHFGVAVVNPFKHPKA